MNYEQAMEFIYSTSWMGSKLGLYRMEELMRRLGSPQNRIPCIHIAGTNGKGSTAAMLASVYTEAGYKTGLYTSPAISYFGERMQINGRPIPEEAIASLALRMKKAADKMEDEPTEYELITALAYLYLADEKVDIAIIETGLGGLLDATNVLDAPAAIVLTAIGLDHTKELGERLEDIAAQKAGIIKNDAPVIVYEQDEPVLSVIHNKAAAQHAPVHLASPAGYSDIRYTIEGTHFTDEKNRTLLLPLLGTHQIHNAAVALTTIDALQARFPVEEQALASGLAKTRWPGRFELLHTDPIVLLDGAHNPQAARALKKNLTTYFPDRKIRFIVGILADKGYNNMAEELLPIASAWITVTPDSDRALPAHVLTRLLEEHGQSVRESSSLREALSFTLKEADPSEILCVFGTLTIIHEVRSFFDK